MRCTSPRRAEADHAEGLRTTHAVGRARIRLNDGTRSAVRFFASRVDHSGACRVSLLPELRTETLARLMRDHFEELGGVPTLASFDASGPTSLGERYRATIVGAMRGIGVDVSMRSRSEGRLLVDEVTSTFFDGQNFVDLRDVEEKLETWCTTLSLRRFGRSGEHVRLRPLVVGPDGFAVPVDVTIGAAGVVSVAGHQYTVPCAPGAHARALLYPAVAHLLVGDREFLLRRKAG